MNTVTFAVTNFDLYLKKNTALVANVIVQFFFTIILSSLTAIIVL